MNAFEQPRNEDHRVTPPPPAFDDDAYRNIFDVELPTAEDLEKSRKAKEQLEQGFDWKDPNVIEMSTKKSTEQEARVEKARAERIARDAEAIQKLSENIKKAA